jgi:ketosteroid isomerase-like protein
MTYLSEDATLLAGGLLLLAGACLVALRVTQQGKHLIWAGVALSLALIVVITEWCWVTDKERIEEVIYGLRHAVLSADAEAVLACMAPTVQYLQGDFALSEDATRELVRSNLSHARFDFVRITDLQISVGHQSRRGKAEFRVFARGSRSAPITAPDSGTAASTWSLGFVETKPGTWKVNRISPISVPLGALALPGNTPYSDDIEYNVAASQSPTGMAKKRLMFNPRAANMHKQGNVPTATSGSN